MMQRFMLVFVLGLVGASGLGGQDAARLTMVEELRIGSVDDPDYALSAVGDIRIGPAGEMYVWQDMAYRLIVFDATGQRQYAVGGRGSGPGEFLGSTNWTWVADTLAAFDRMQQRFSFFLADGTHVRTGRILSTSSASNVLLDRFLGDGSITGVVRGRLQEGVGQPRLRFGPTGLLLNSLFIVRPIPSAGIARLSRGTIVTFRRPAEVEDADLVAHDPLGRHVTVVERSVATSGGPSSGRVYRVGIDGDTIFDRRFQYTPRSVDRAWSDSVVSEFRRSWSARAVIGGGRLDRAEMDQLVDALSLPAFYPPVSSAAVGRDGSTWLRRSPESGSSRWIVMDRRGEVVSHVEGPTSLEIRNADGDVVWGVVQDELDVPYVVRYRLVRVP
jgi:hypothetical protein